MKDILAPANRQVLDHLASSDTLLAFDYDGTLAPIVKDPVQAHMRQRTSDLLAAVADTYPCVVISGRGQEDVQQRVSAAGIFEVIGNHGLEPRCPREADAVQVHGCVPELRRALAGRPGIVIEDKVYSVAIHYRGSPAPRAARMAILRAAASLDGVRIIGGKRVINLVPRQGPHKGTALATAREKFGCEVALYVGDDETDEDVFALDDPQRLLTVRVGRKRASRAAFYVTDQKSVDSLLATLLRLREDAWRDR